MARQRRGRRSPCRVSNTHATGPPPPPRSRRERADAKQRGGWFGSPRGRSVVATGRRAIVRVVNDFRRVVNDPLGDAAASVGAREYPVARRVGIGVVPRATRTRARAHVGVGVAFSREECLATPTAVRAGVHALLHEEVRGEGARGGVRVREREVRGVPGYPG